MKEEILQQKIVEVVKANQFLEFIINKENVDVALRADTDDQFIPDFSIDSLIRRRYSESAKRVLSCLYDYELISGETIKNISLKKGELLYPDLIIFNRTLKQIILVENKTKAQTEREALTELLGYTNEIRNHLPFISNFDIHYILISSDFNTLLDHSIASQLLSSSINFLCLKPVISLNEIINLDVHFPKPFSQTRENPLER